MSITQATQGAPGRWETKVTPVRTPTGHHRRMCFSAEVDLVAGAVVTVIGVDALRHVRRPSELPLAALPCVLGAHLLVEVLVWRGLEGTASARTLELATWAYALIAYVIVPVLAAVAVTLWEPPGSRRRMLPFVAMAVGAAAVLLWWQLRDPVVAQIQGHHIDYVIRAGTASGLVAVPYVLGTCGPALLSHDRALRLFGALNVVVVAVLAVVEREGLVSLWCAWAAVTSVVIAARLRSRAGSALAGLGVGV
jgi:hypothetical protein